MWRESSDWFEVHRATLARAGISLAARLRPDSGLLSSYSGGVVRLALPDPGQPDGVLRATLLSGVLGIAIDDVARLFRTQLPRLVAHEIGHALRSEAGRMGEDPWAEEQAAERIACCLSRPHLGAAARSAALSVLEPITQRLGGVAEALTVYRLSESARAMLDLGSLPPRPPPTRAQYRDLATFTRISVAWTYFDLRLDPEDDIDAIRNELLVAG